MKTSSLLQKALRKLKNGKNWTKDDYNDRGHYCAIGAIRAANGTGKFGYTPSIPAYELSKFITTASDNLSPQDKVIEFNDADGVKFGDIKKIFNKAIYATRKAGD